MEMSNAYISNDFCLNLLHLNNWLYDMHNNVLKYPENEHTFMSNFLIVIIIKIPVIFVKLFINILLSCLLNRIRVSRIFCLIPFIHHTITIWM